MTFNEFLNKSSSSYFINKEFNDKKLYIKLKSGNTKVVADGYPKITEVDLFDFNDKTINFIVGYKTINYKNSDISCTVSLSRGTNPKIEFLEVESVRDLLHTDTYIDCNEKVLFALFKNYFKAVLLADLKNYNSMLFEYGWYIKDEDHNSGKQFHFVPVTDDGYWKPKSNKTNVKDIDDALFNGMIFNKDNQLSHYRTVHCQNDVGIAGKSLIDIKKETNRFKLFFDFILENKDTIGIFAYSVHSIFWNYTLCGAIGDKEKMNTRASLQKGFNDVFAICIHGKDLKIVNSVANLLSNLFFVDVDDIATLYTNKIIPCDKPNPERFINYAWQSVPILVTNEKGIITKKSSIVNRLQSLREKRIAYFFPVYLNSRPLKLEEAEDFCADSLKYSLTNDRNINLLKEEINYLFLLFVHFLSTVSNSEDRNEHFNELGLIYDRTVEEISKLKGFKRNKKNSVKLLYAAIKGFCYFLRKIDMIDEADRMQHQAYQFLIDADPLQMNNIEKVNVIKDTTLESFKDYIMGILKKKEMERPDFFCIQNESRGKKEKCFYLIEEGFINDFDKFLDHRQKIDYLTLQKKLVQHGLLKRRSNGSQYNLLRTPVIKGMKITGASCLVIMVEEFEAIFGITVVE
jgi:hypothetical protein